MNTRALKFVNVDAVVSPMPPYRAKIARLINKTVDEIIAFARVNPGVFAFNFVDLPPDEIPDYRGLLGHPDCNHVVMPFYTGGLKGAPQVQLMDELIERSLGCTLSDCDEMTGVR